MKILPVCLVFALTSLRLAAADVPPIPQIIAEDGQFAFTDGSSYYLFNKDTTFRSQPMGMSGRTISGHWKQQDGTFVIEGQWGWINGTSKLNDFRRMRLTIYPEAVETDKEKRSVEIIGVPAKLYRCYFVINELVEIAPPKQLKEQSQSGGLPVQIMNAVVTIEKKRGATVAFDVAGHADVTVAVKTQQGKLLAPVRQFRVLSGTAYKVQWNGKDITGKSMPAGTYWFHIHANARGTNHQITKPIIYKQ